MKRIISPIATAALLVVTSMPSFAASPWIVENTTTKEECSACHMAYPAGFLPERSWRAIMANLTDHFGEDASLGDAARTEITNYLVALAPKELRNVSSIAVPLRITELRWFRGEHGSRRVAQAQNDPRIGSISNCAACHRAAERGNFDD